MDKEPITLNGLNKLKDELVFLKEKKRPQIVSAIAEARSHGDLKENAEYHAAKEQQGFIEGRIKEIESKLSNVQEIDVTIINAGGKVVFGSTVTLIDLQNNDEITYKIVGEDEADIKSNLISYSSPIARAIIGKFEGDDVVFQAPGGEREYEVVSVEYL